MIDNNLEIHNYENNEDSRSFKDENSELWASVVGYEDLYLISSLGRLKRLASIVKHPTGSPKKCRERILKNNSKRKYRQFTICKEGARENLLVHRLVASAFIPNPGNKPCVNHLDGDTHNNAVYNLAWATYSENEKHSYSALKKIGTSYNLKNYSPEWETVISVNGYNIRGAARKTMYQMLKNGLTIDDLLGKDLPKSSFEKLICFLRKRGVKILTSRAMVGSRKLFYKISQ